MKEDQKMKELVSVVVPIYNTERYLRRCVDSIINQTCENLEIILVDDGSPDKCGKICDEYAKKDKRVRVIHKENGGLSEARNAGIEASEGEYVTFIDSDDWVHDQYVEKLYKLLVESNSDIASCGLVKATSEYIKADASKVEIYDYSNIEALEQLMGRFYTQLCITCAKLYKTNLFKETRFPVGRLHEDEATTYKVIFKAKKIILTTAPLYYYWQRSDSIMGVEFNKNGWMDALEAYKERGEFFKEIGCEKLVSRNYNILFFVFMDKIADVTNKKEFITSFKELRNELRKSRQSLKFKLFYEAYYIAPNTMNLVHKIMES